MNFTREPILETIISAKEGYKLKLKSTKHEGSAEYLVDAIEVVSFGTTFFYRSGEPAHTFFVPAQDFEIEQVRQARLALKAPVEKNIKIAGGAEGGKKPSEKSRDKRKQKPVKEAAKPKDVEKKNPETTPVAEGKAEENPVKKTTKDKPVRRTVNKRVSKDRKKAEKEAAEAAASDEAPQPSMFSHLLRPPEALISDNIHKYQNIIDNQNQEKGIEANEEKQEAKPVDVVADKPIDDPELTSEAPKPFEKLTEEQEEKEKPLTLKEKMKKVLAPAMKVPENQEEDK